MKFSDLTPVRSGKVRDVYEAGENLVIVASDRISAFDCILPTPIPDKGKILNTLSVFWLARTAHLIDNHLLLHHTADFPAPFNIPELDGRSMLVRRAEVVPIECVVRGYLAGSGWKDYQKSGSVSGIALRDGLVESDKLPEPIWTPSTKAESGHDEPISFDGATSICGEKTARQLREASLMLYDYAAKHARKRGLILADTKFEFGFADGQLILVDEAFTPDSSRFWDAQLYAPGRAQDSFDKQYVRDYLETLDWDKTPPAPILPPEVAQRTSEKYQQAYNRITGLTWPNADVRAA